MARHIVRASSASTEWTMAHPGYRKARCTGPRARALPTKHYSVPGPAIPTTPAPDPTSRQLKARVIDQLHRSRLLHQRRCGGRFETRPPASLRYSRPRRSGRAGNAWGSFSCTRAPQWTGRTGCRPVWRHVDGQYQARDVAPGTCHIATAGEGP